MNIKHNCGPVHAHWRLLSETAAVRKVKEYMRVTMHQTGKSWDTCLVPALIDGNKKTRLALAYLAKKLLRKQLCNSQTKTYHFLKNFPT